MHYSKIKKSVTYFSVQLRHVANKSVTDLVRQIKKKYKGYVKYSYPIKDMKRGHNVRFHKYQRTLIKKKVVRFHLKFLHFYVSNIFDV